MNRLANIYAFWYDHNPTQPKDCGTMSGKEIAEHESEIQDRVDTLILQLKRMLRQGEYKVHSVVDTAENEVADYDEAARTLFIFYALDLEFDYLPASVRVAAKNYVGQVRAVLTKIESEKPC